ncbi:NADPH-dependent FMN reductase [Kribbella sp. NPDC055071]
MRDEPQPTDHGAKHMSKPLLLVIIGSVRPGRIGPAYAQWFCQVAAEHGDFEIAVTDLAELDLPFHDEPHHPKLGRYLHDHTKLWSRQVAAADAIVFVTPEYNYGYGAAVKNAIDYLHAEWADKAVGFVGYGGIGAGTRAIQQLKQVVTTLRMVPIFEAVNVAFAAQQLAEDGSVRPSVERDGAAIAMLDELRRVTGMLRSAAVPSQAQQLEGIADEHSDDELRIARAGGDSRGGPGDGAGAASAVGGHGIVAPAP